MKKILGVFIEVILAGIVLVFEFTQSINFFLYVFPADQWYLSYTGFGLTSGAMLGYLYLFLYVADTKLKKTISLLMVLVGVLGVLATAGFGMQIEAWSKSGWELGESDFAFMVLAVKILIAAHAISLTGFLAGDQIVKAFQDEDGDGIPNIIDPDYKRNKMKLVHTNASDVELVQLREENARLKAAQEAPKADGRS